MHDIWGSLLTALKVAGIIACMVMIVPLMVLGGTGSWRHAWYALKSYLKVMGMIVALGGGAALFTLLAQWIG